MSWGYGMSCSKPIDAALLSDYWFALLPDSEEEVVEEHLLACDECGQQLREVIAIAEGVRKLAREGSLLMVVTDAFLERAAEQGIRIRQYAPPAGGRIDCTVTAEDDLLISRLAANLSAAKQVDLCICNAEGQEKIRLRDIPVDQAASGVVFQQPIGYAKAAPSETIIARLVAVDESSGEQLLGEYTFNHIRTMPGPAAW
jgi:Putative zinc-finger